MTEQEAVREVKYQLAKILVLTLASRGYLSDKEKAQVIRALKKKLKPVAGALDQ